MNNLKFKVGDKVIIKCIYNHPKDKKPVNVIPEIFRKYVKEKIVLTVDKLTKQNDFPYSCLNSNGISRVFMEKELEFAQIKNWKKHIGD